MKKIVILGLISILSCFIGCGKNSILTSMYVSNDSSQGTSKLETLLTVEEHDISTWSIPLNQRFVPISSYNIQDGTTTGIDFKQFVDLNTGVMYILVEKYGSGYGVSFEVIVDSEGKPCVYENLDSLREWYWK